MNRVGAAGLPDGRSDALYRLCGGLCDCKNRLGVSLGLVDHGLLFAFGAGDKRFALAGGDVDLLLSAAFRSCNKSPFFALCGDLLLHRVQNFFWRREVFDFIAQYLHTPVQRRFVNRLYHLGIDDVALLKGFVKLELTDHRAQRGLGQLRYCHDVVA